MSGRVVQLDTEAHADVRALLPWYANQTLADYERRLVEVHLATCPRCRAELEWERQLIDTGMLAQPTGDVEAALVRMHTDIAERRRRNLVKWFATAWASLRQGPVWMPWAMAAQLCVIAVLAGLLWVPRHGEGDYHALSAADQGKGATLMVMFRPGTTEAQMRLLLDASHARLVDGPTEAGAYVLSVPSAESPAALKQLRQSGAVTLAEPIGRTQP